MERRNLNFIELGIITIGFIVVCYFLILELIISIKLFQFNLILLYLTLIVIISIFFSLEIYIVFRENSLMKVIYYFGLKKKIDNMIKMGMIEEKLDLKRKDRDIRVIIQISKKEEIC